jgi:hypothetical protein
VHAPVSEAQAEANRLNAQKSTGPRTEAGKAASSANSRSHGLAGRIEFQHPEDQRDYAMLGQRMVVEMQPATVIEEHLLQTILDSQWQMNRCRAFDEQIWNERAAGIFEREDGLTLELVNRYLQMHTRANLRAIETLRKIQNARRKAERDALIGAFEQQTKQVYNRRKHGLLIYRDGFVLQACHYQDYFSRPAAPTEAETASGQASRTA